ncbi:myosin light chain kinase 2, skeletal/cardiac muscle isoform X2 [Lepisosteus oculatus]|uniref:myosin light chain kinase 2, skeletal/cardiac muscle isoform X2 n=1 Tax=Lepisosteus oculatus TaxID=7918 RepID=UPI00073FFEDA|nr:PREDICTED: myosin light chain kinase family member 4 isoform X2 [Lepisosteus oculatus]
MSTPAKQSSTLVNSLAKVYDPNPMHSQGPTGIPATPRKVAGEPKKPAADSANLLDVKIDSLNRKMDKLINIQEKVLRKLDGLSQDIDGIEQDVETLKVDKEGSQPAKSPKTESFPDMKLICQELTSMLSVVNQRTEQQAKRLDGMEKIVLSIQQVISFIGETVKTSKVMELIFKSQSPLKGSVASPVDRQKDSKHKQTVKRHASSDKSEVVTSKRVDKLRDLKGKDVKDKSSSSSLKGLKCHKKKKPPDTAEAAAQRKPSLLDEEVQKLNKQNAEKSGQPPSPAMQDLEAGRLDENIQRSPASQGPKDTVLDGQFEALPVSAAASDLVDFILEVPYPQGSSTAQQEPEGPEVEKQDRKAPIVQEEEDLEGDSTETESQEGRVDIELEAHEDKEEEDAKGDKIQEESEAEEISEVEEATLKALSETPEVKGKSTAEGEQLSEGSYDSLTQNGSLIPERHEVHERSDSILPEAGQGTEQTEVSSSSKRRVTEEDVVKDDHKKSRVEEACESAGPEQEQKEEQAQTEAEEAEGENGTLPAEEQIMEYFIDCSPPPPAPFDHRVVSAKPVQITNFYTINKQEILGGGRFGQVHKCIENSSGLTLAAKIIKAKSPKEKDEVKNEIQVMNQLNHASLIQLYAAYESKNDIILVMEYVDGGELFDRIIDENYNLTELDTIHFIRQICEGIQYMHHMYILHLDLKPENILCVSRATNKIKIIDFGLARRYKPREKLKVNFGTPEFLAPEVINYEFVSFPTDMWSLGVITYMLLSGLSPFLGEDDNETLNNILACQWSLEDEEFADISEEAKDFISRLIVKDKCWRITAAESLKHPWLSNRNLHYRLHQKKNKCHSSHAPPAET